jgi:hypothetical protein
MEACRKIFTEMNSINVHILRDPTNEIIVLERPALSWSQNSAIRHTHTHTQEKKNNNKKKP